MANFAFISNEPTPYRLHLLKRLADELPDMTVHSIFTHRLRHAHMPWQLNVDQIPNPVFFETQDSSTSPGNLLANLRHAHRRYRDIRDYIVSHDIQLMILNGYADLTRLWLLNWASKHRLPVVLRGDSNIHGQAQMNIVRRWVKRRLLRWVRRRLTGLMPMGQCGEDFFDYWMGPHDLPIFWCPYEPDYQKLCVVDPQARDAFIRAHDMVPQRKRFLYCGRLIAIKCVDVILKAFIQVAPERPDWDLVIAGTGDQEVMLKAMVPEALQSRIRFVGFLQFDQTVACYHGCDVLVHPPRHEPWALVINEAVAAGLAVIASNVTGAAAQLVKPGVNGLLVSPGEVSSLVQAMLHITEGTTAERMGRASAEVLAAWRKRADPVAAVARAMALVDSSVHG